MKKTLIRSVSRLLNAKQRKRLRYYLTVGLEKLGVDQFPAHNELDRKLLKYIGDRKGGVFIEAGANDGLSQSNTWYLERKLGWSGLLIEPIPWIAEICRKQRNAIVESCALGGFDQEGTTTTLYYGALMTVAEDTPGSHLEEGGAKAHAESGASWVGEEAIPFESEIHALSTLLDKYSLSRVDLLSLDVEGYELNVLSGVDMDRHIIDYILVETGNLAAVDELLGSHYDRVDQLSFHDYLYRRRTEQPGLRVIHSSD
ncbi:FkbM family methyltransferase [Methyloligella sp. 2.7D]|uniref:FkbM family methyltransferase n=1 Tax=unclassified Methyloligella TaxID=2625955 RepID=UPI00157BC05D|nr:FkbM family methyltransferase [Methyloligella sp. GL2]QKP78195.1 FkbM family methyltransferase [Methyloligella sp. GL2]